VALRWSGSGATAGGGSDVNRMHHPTLLNALNKFPFFAGDQFEAERAISEKEGLENPKSQPSSPAKSVVSGDMQAPRWLPLVS
jgi:hypothetical protein